MKQLLAEYFSSIHELQPSSLPCRDETDIGFLQGRQGEELNYNKLHSQVPALQFCMNVCMQFIIPSSLSSHVSVLLIPLVVSKYLPEQQMSSSVLHTCFKRLQLGILSYFHADSIFHSATQRKFSEHVKVIQQHENNISL